MPRYLVGDYTLTSMKKFSRFIAWSLIAFEGLSLALLVGILYGLLSKSMAQEFSEKLHHQRSETSAALLDRLHSLEMRLGEISSNNTIRVSLMLGLESQLQEVMDKTYPPSDGALFLIHKKTNPLFVPRVPEILTDLKPYLDRLALDDHPRKANFVYFGNGRFLSVFSMPVKRRGERLGTGLVVYDISEDMPFWRRLAPRATGSLCVWDQGSLVDLRTGHSKPVPEGILNISKMEVVSSQGEAFVPLQDFPGIVYVASSQPLKQKRASLIYTLAILCIAVFLMTLLVAFIIARKVSSPLRIMANQALSIAKEPSSPPLREEELRYVEFRKLAQAFNQVLKSLLSAQEKLVRQEKLALLGELAGGVAHEIRNPLGAIKNAAYLLNMAVEEPEPEVKETIEILQNEIETSERVVSNLLDFARPKPPTRLKVDINDVLQTALSRITVPENVKVVWRLDETLPTIAADPKQLGQVFENIMLNAFQAMPEGGQLTIKSEAPGAEWAVTVSFIDTGVGIEEEALGKVFEPLFTTKAKGIGLGLALTKSLVEGHGGTIDLNSTVGKGTTFTVRIPIGVDA